MFLGLALVWVRVALGWVWFGSGLVWNGFGSAWLGNSRGICEIDWNLKIKMIHWTISGLESNRSGASCFLVWLWFGLELLWVGLGLGWVHISGPSIH